MLFEQKSRFNGIVEKRRSRFEIPLAGMKKQRSCFCPKDSFKEIPLCWNDKAEYFFGPRDSSEKSRRA